LQPIPPAVTISHATARPSFVKAYTDQMAHFAAADRANTGIKKSNSEQHDQASVKSRC
jgi:hypothetical protein